LTNADEAIARLAGRGQLSARLWDLFQHRLVTIVRVAEGPSLAFDIATLAVTALLFVLLMRRGRLVVARVAVPALLVFALFVVIVPPAMFGVGYVADRMPLVLAMLFVGALDLRRRYDSFETATFAVMAALVAMRLAGIALLWQDYATDQRDFDAVASRLPRGALVETVVVGGDRLDYSHRRCAMFGPLLVAEHGVATRLFANEDQQPLVIAGPLRDAIARAGRPDRRSLAAPDYFDVVVAAASSGAFPFVLICDADRLTQPLPPQTRPVAAQGRFTLLAVAQSLR
jgi:hypothetical protein